MDINYILGREQISLRRAVTSGSRSARAVHRLFAKSYGLLLERSPFPHGDTPVGDETALPPTTQGAVSFERWENEGGRVS